MIVGALRHGFVPVSVVRELCHATRPGGFVCMSRIDPKVESGDKYRACLERELQLMEEEGLWAALTTRDMDTYMTHYKHGHMLHGTMYLCRKSDSFTRTNI